MGRGNSGGERVSIGEFFGGERRVSESLGE